MTTIDLAMRVATQLQSEGKLVQSESILNSILESFPTHAYALHLLGIIAYQCNKLELGIKLIQQAIEHNPDIYLFHSNLGEMYRKSGNIQLSILCGERALALDPNSATILSNLGIAYYDNHQYEHAEDCHKRALEINPKLSCSLNNMGSIYKTCGKTKEAIEYYQAAIDAGPSFVDAYCNMGHILIELDNHDKAFNYFAKALQLKPDLAQTIACHQFLAEIYNQQGNYIQAIKHLDYALTLDPTAANLHLTKGSVLMEMGEITKAEQTFANIDENATIDKQILAHYSLVQLRKINKSNPSLQKLLEILNQEVALDKMEYVYFALGKCYDDMGEWSKAFDYFTKGCQLKRQKINYNITDQIQFTNKLINKITPHTIEHLRSFANPSTRPIFIVGMPRSGSTLVEQILASHASVHGGGELKYLSNLININNYPDNILQLTPSAITEQYLNHLQRISAKSKHITDKMPHNFLFIGIIHALFPNAKIIHVKRNPIDTCLSCYTKLFSQGHYYSYDLTELGQYYICYEHIMNHWRQILPANVWLDITYENLINDLDTQAKRLLEFCNLSWDPACLQFYESKRQVRTASFMQIRQPIYNSSVERWRRFAIELKPLINVLNQGLPSNMCDHNSVSL